jgi:predicted branched-subunit amino acid permease
MTASSAKPPSTAVAAFVAGVRGAATSVFALVLFGTYIGIGALAHDLGFSLIWVIASTLLIWAGPAQVIAITLLGAGAPWIEAAIAVGLSGVRLLPMVVALLPILKGPRTTQRALILPAHFTAVSMWVEAVRLAPEIPREHRVAFANGLGTGFMISATAATIAGHSLAATLPALLSAALLFLTPLSFLVSVARNAKHLVDRLALVLGLAIAPVLAYAEIELDLLWTGVIGGTLAWLVHRVREAAR